MGKPNSQTLKLVFVNVCLKVGYGWAVGRSGVVCFCRFAVPGETRRCGTERLPALPFPPIGLGERRLEEPAHVWEG